MKPSILVLSALMGGAFFIGRISQAGDDRPESVVAKKYRIFYADSVCDAIHGGGGWNHGFFLPEAKVAASLNYRWDLHLSDKDRPSEQVPTLVARFADKPENDLVGFTGGAPTQVEELHVPTDLAQEIAEYAALTKRFREEGDRLGREVRTRLRLEPIPREREQ